ncbi:MAG: tRNA (uridine(34)/cytosine(34)/5-carboxymethylaminomethyluridine(34)-2'-O)-methyltransferase TrmL [Gammaproteobacteria bacterium]|nr:tRNA (uridine(34)/cytosine(34)/5-carboxymethylaminomethyluridine(34)-2'-O)-methyltransferase TrmL [Gammaproteobacteria bacterium]
MLNIVLYEPEIPPNTGNIIRLCANSGAKLHLIKPLGFELDDKNLRRAGLDYRDLTQVIVHKNFDAFISNAKPKRVIACSTKGTTSYTNISYKSDDFLLFGPETRGLPKEILDKTPKELIARIPMRKNIRSLNLSNAVAIILYEAWRQLKFT